MNLIQHLDNLIDFKLNEINKTTNKNKKRKLKQATVAKAKNIKSEIEKRLRIRMKIFINYGLSSRAGSYNKNIENHFINEIYSYVEKELNNVKIDIQVIVYILCFMYHLAYGRFDVYETTMISQAVVIYLFKSFHDSGKFSRIYRNEISISQVVFIVKVENFEIVFFTSENLFKHKIFKE